MNSNNLLIREYLSSLNEDKELDYIFPILLNIMGFRIVQTAKEAKGQSQYGKDIIAIGKDINGKTYRWYFELKGHKDKDITDKNFSAQDGIRESIIEAKDTAFNDSSIPEFNHLPIKIVLVHNGVIKANIRPTFEGFISREFKNDEFERWDIYYLTDLFSKYLFNEYLLIDDESNRLFKRTLAFLDAPDNDFDDYKKLVQSQFEKLTTVKGRALNKLFSTLGLLLSIIFHYSKENNYLVPAKETSKFLIIYTWKWILNNKLENRKAIIKELDKLLRIQLDIFNAYFKKTFHIARIEDGLFAENGIFYEKIGYPLRSFQYLDDIIYYSRLRQHFTTTKEALLKLKNKQKDLIIELVNNNSGFKRPILDFHSIPIIQLFMFFADSSSRRQKDVDFIYSYIFDIVQNLKIEKIKNNRLPELYNNIELVIEYFATGKRPEEYTDSSSILIAILLELSTIFNSKTLFEEILSFIEPNLSLQIANIDFNFYNVEELLFEKNLNREYFVENIDILGNMEHLVKKQDFEKFKLLVKEKLIKPYEFRTDKKGYKFLRYLAHSYYKNEILPNEWRILIKK